jgi:hypothetical protein
MKETRQQQRQKQRDEFKKQEAMRKQMSSAVTKAEFFQIVEVFNRLRDRMMHLDIFSSAVEKVLIDKGLVTRDEIEAAFEYESKRAVKFNEINNQKGNYVARLEVCKEWQIDPSVTQIPDQILADADLADEEKLKLANDFNIKRLIEIIENNKKEEKKDELN